MDGHRQKLNSIHSGLQR